MKPWPRPSRPSADVLDHQEQLSFEPAHDGLVIDL
jgi:hypothetical protein